jgi:hypothetical protein
MSAIRTDSGECGGTKLNGSVLVEMYSNDDGGGGARVVDMSVVLAVDSPLTMIVLLLCNFEICILTTYPHNNASMQLGTIRLDEDAPSPFTYTYESTVALPAKELAFSRLWEKPALLRQLTNQL